MASIVQWTFDVQDVERTARFWAGVLGFRISMGADGNAKLYPPDDAPPATSTVWLQASAGPKGSKNRNHPDLNADGDFDAELLRVLALGATGVDVGQSGDEPFVVLADPEGNEFCLLRNRPRAV